MRSQRVRHDWRDLAWSILAVPRVKREGAGGRSLSQRPDLAKGERNDGVSPGTGPSRWELTPWSLSTVQMSGRAFLSTSWTSKAWKPAAREQSLTEPPETLAGQPTLPSEASQGAAAERWREHMGRQLFAVPRPSDRGGPA